MWPVMLSGRMKFDEVVRADFLSALLWPRYSTSISVLERRRAEPDRLLEDR